jgi:hypothetical protein
MSRRLALLCLAALVLVLVQGSAGDHSNEHSDCRRVCDKTCRYSHKDNEDEKLPWAVRLLWTCEANCYHDCTEAHHHRRLATGGEPTKYFGKWRFTRVLGLQEIASVLFSLGNGYAHVHFLLNKQRIPKSYWARDLFLMYAVVAINTWVWSTVFHARY